MALGTKAFPLTVVSHVLGIVAVILVLFWNIHFRGGLAWEAKDKNLIFNTSKRQNMHVTDAEQIKLAHQKGSTCALRTFKKRVVIGVIHPVLMLLGLVVIGGEAIISYKALPLRKEVKKIIHLVLHAIGLILGIVGISAAFKNHNESGIPNLYSLHSWIGIGVTSLYGIQWLYGLLTFFYPGGSLDLRRASLPWHVVFGLLVYIIVVGNSALGFLEKLTFLESGGVARYGSEAFLVNFTAITTILFAIFVILSVISKPASASAEEDHAYSAIG